MLFYTTLTEERSKYLRSVLINEGIICERVKVDDPYHIEDIVAIIGDEVDSYKSGCLLNLTGGTKPMAFAGFESAARRIFLSVICKARVNATCYFSIPGMVIVIYKRMMYGK